MHPGPRGRSSVVLLADDSELTLAMTKSYLEARSMRVFTTTAASRVVALAREYRPDLVVLDFEMPVMNGDEVCRRLKSDETTSPIPVLVMTSHDDEETARRVTEAGAVMMIRKSGGREAILEAVSRVLNIPVRRHLRMPCRLSVGVVAPEGTLEGAVHNLSEGGLYLVLATPIENRTAIHLLFRLPGSDHPISIVGEILRSEVLDEGGHGHGVGFIEADSRSIEALERFIKDTIG